MNQYGMRRDDAKVYEIELAADATPLTTPDRPFYDEFRYDSEPATGWALHFVIIRDHMSCDQLRQHLSDAASIPIDSIQKFID